MGRTWTWKRTMCPAAGLVALAAMLAAPVASAGQEAVDLLRRPARLDLGESALPDALRALQTASGVALAYSPDLLPADHRVACPCADSTVASTTSSVWARLGNNAS